jgi:hypothetical protein
MQHPRLLTIAPGGVNSMGGLHGVGQILLKEKTDRTSSHPVQ